MKEEVRSWWKLAEDDLDKAEVLLNAEKYDGGIFFCQQAVEKALKALWIAQKKTEAPKYHDLSFFFKQLHLPERFRTICEDLTGGYITTRYPTELKADFSKHSTIALINKSWEILQWIKEKLS